MSSAYTLRHTVPSGSEIADEPAGKLTPDVLTKIISAKAFGLAFQPVVRLSDRLPVLYEVLLRPTRGSISTASLVAGAVELGQTIALDQAVLDATRTIAVPISVNICAASLLDRGLVATILQHAGDNPSTRTIEVTHLSGCQDVDSLVLAIRELRRAGVWVALDDCNASDVCMRLLEKSQFDLLKLGLRAASSPIAQARGRQRLAAFSRLAVATGTRLAAKYVETLPQAWLVEELGVDWGQGWFFGAPQPRLPP